ncbi:hypothetical protein [Streptomyces blattellae]|uniref:hypothetical protein n=1 Tax=Streptomyces blattellae TaxID=2569855 RepID=UPI0012B6BB6F|nr:hypothetical protein [Streptomyces blattellae]
MLNLTKTVQGVRERRLEAENRKLREQVALLTGRLADLQSANERMYADDHDATGGPGFDPGQPFGSEPKRKLGTLWLKGGTK